MPRDLSIEPEPYQHQWKATDPYEKIFTGWAYPPKDYEEWTDLVFQWGKHCRERYGDEEVATWYWETWNEANAPYWRGSPNDFFKLHDYSIAAVRRAIPKAVVGGPDTAGSGGQFTRDFLEHCLRGKNFATGEVGTPLDFIAFHAKGAPRYIEGEQGGHVRMGIAEQLRTIDDGFGIVASFPELKSKPIVIGESDPEGCAACQGPQLAYRNDTMYSSYTAAVFAGKHELAARHGVNLEGALMWAFEFENQPYFAGFASGDGDTLYVTLWNYHDDDLPGPAADVTFKLENLLGDLDTLTVEHFLIDARHSNAYSAWQKMGFPQSPTPTQFAELEQAGRLGEWGADRAGGGRGWSGDGEFDSFASGGVAVGA